MSSRELGLPEQVMLDLTGEVWDLSDARQIAQLGVVVREYQRKLRDLRDVADRAARGELERQGRTSIIVDGYVIEEGAGKAQIDADGLYAQLRDEVGMDETRLGELFQLRVRDQRELAKLERRHDDVAKAVEAHRVRGRGTIIVKDAGPAAFAPRPSEHQIERAREQTQAERRAEELGI